LTSKKKRREWWKITIPFKLALQQKKEGERTRPRSNDLDEGLRTSTEKEDSHMEVVYMPLS
jgi:hypothetical protein